MVVMAVPPHLKECAVRVAISAALWDISVMKLTTTAGYQPVTSEQSSTTCCLPTTRLASPSVRIRPVIARLVKPVARDEGAVVMGAVFCLMLCAALIKNTAVQQAQSVMIRMDCAYGRIHALCLLYAVHIIVLIVRCFTLIVFICFDPVILLTTVSVCSMQE